ncbi:MAG: hypothetical protein Q7S03_01670 [bacterium]|nr:hypothetical protein [bacterium]
MAFWPQKQTQTSTPTISKEKEVGPFGPSRQAEKGIIVEAGRIPETQAEQEGYIERVEKEIELKKPVTYHGQVLVTSPAAQVHKIVLPVSQSTYLAPPNWHLPITSALRWLLAWTKKIIKVHPGETVFRSE